ncbi:hypothetical protein GCM10025863_07030 [Microbacterium suwonense]|uniref:Uncharacterized protein n=1 Tax=Microbacterium suwonense TaxID=683047 RepID=A0ABM8FRT4_9MICO|nr:hypothetical protein GCM10025863_07030 [Microbacterium suwonense]
MSSAPTHLISVESAEIGCRWWAPSFGAHVAPKLSVRDVAHCASITTIPILQVRSDIRAVPAAETEPEDTCPVALP